MEKSDFRYDIHSLRALAVLSVLFYHSNLNFNDFYFFSGGFLGVDIFFVISGYLITKIIIEEIQINKFEFIKFYERRIRRIFPSLFLLLIIVSFLSYFIMNEKQYYENSNAILSTIFFVSNFFFLFQDSYTSVESQFKPLLHTWSLGVEEQFYIFFPFLLYYAIFLKKNVEKILILILILSLILCLSLTKFYPDKNFFFSLSRFWELLSGSLCFLLQKKISVKAKFKKIACINIWFLILLCLIFFDNKDNHPGLPNIIIIILTSSIILINYNESLIFKNKLISFFGNISYTLYLFHLPFYSFTRIKLGELSNLIEIFLLILSILVSSIIYFFYEKKLKIINTKKLIIILSSMFFVLLIFSINNIYNNYLSKQVSINNKIYIIDDEKELRWKYLVKNCEARGWENCYKPDLGKKNILVLGDSLSPDSGNIFSLLTKEEEYYIITDTLGGCPPAKNIKRLVSSEHPNLKKCDKLNKSRFDKDYYEDIDVVVIHNLYDWFKPDDLKDYVDFLKSINLNKIIIVGNYIALNKEFVKIIKEDKSIIKNEKIPKKYLKHKLIYEDELKNFANMNDLFYLSFSGLCSPSCKLFTEEKYPFSWDEHHLSEKFVEFFIKNYSYKNQLIDYLKN